MAEAMPHLAGASTQYLTLALLNHGFTDNIVAVFITAVVETLTEEFIETNMKFLLILMIVLT